MERDIQHIEDVLDNATKKITENVPGVIEKICSIFRREIGTFKKSLMSTLYQVWEQLNMAQSIYDEYKRKHRYHHERLISFLETYILVFEGMRSYLSSFNLPDPITKEKIYRRGRHNGKKKDRRELIEELNKFLFDKTLRSIIIDTGIKAAKEFKKMASEIGEVLTENRMDFSPRELVRYDPYHIELGILRKYVSEVEEKIPIITRMEVLVNRIRGLEDILRSLLKIKINVQIVKKDLYPSFKRFIKALPYSRHRLSDFRNELNAMKGNLKHIVYKLKNATNLVKYFSIVYRRMSLMPNVPTGCDHCDIPGVISSLVKFREEITTWTYYGRRSRGLSIIQDFYIRGQKHPDSFNKTLDEIQKNVENITKHRIKQLRAIQQIKTHLEKIKKKGGELSSGKSNIGGITKVDDGITKLKEIQRIIEAFSSIATYIESLESTYHFEARTSLDIGGEVKGLMPVISDTVKLKSHIDSYIEFLEKIKGYSKHLNDIENHSAYLSSIKTIERNLKDQINSFNEELSSIRPGICGLVRMGHEISDLKLMKSNIETIRDKIDHIGKHLRAIYDTKTGLNNTYMNITHILRVITWLDWIGSQIQSSSSILSPTGISYHKPQSQLVEQSLEHLKRIKSKIEVVYSKTIQPINEKIKLITSEINCLEQKIDSFMNSFLECSIKSIRNNTTESITRDISHVQKLDIKR